ncbi:MAG: SUMF1/EgtB/PvdO family nonheme iron enzyme [Planctomyces sp.]
MNVSGVFSAERRRILCVAGILLSVTATQAAEPKRVALVIGNSEYEASPLKNPSNDADAVSVALKGLGFSVTTKKDVTKSQFEKAVDEITENLQSGDVCLIFYAGHGQSFENENYLIPVDAVLEHPQHVQERCVSVSYLLQALRFSECSLKIVVVDACRNNPFRSFSRSTAGLAELSNAPDGTIVSFSTSPKTPALDGKGDNSPYVKHLVKAMTMRADQVEIVRLFRETSQAVKTETGQRPFLEFDASMPDYFLKRRRDLVPESPEMESPAITQDSLTNSIGMKLKLIPAGEFVMGSNASRGDLETAGFVLSDAFDNSDEQPAHRVRITRPFYMGIHEVTRGQFAAFVNDTGYLTEAEKDGKGGWGYDAVGNAAQKPAYTWKENGMAQTDSHPVINVSWNDAMEFSKWLSKTEGKQYRLPTEAEWEYCCRAGSETHFSSGDGLASLEGYGNFLDTSFKSKYTSDEDQPFPFDDGFVYTSPVGRFNVNEIGLYDMHGNVWEWCSDWYGKDYYATSPLTDPMGPTSGTNRVYRGGSWSYSARVCRSAYRGSSAPSYRSSYLGFRVALSPSGE